jgi:ferritin
MISKKLENALNKQFNQELYNSNLYLSMSAYFAEQSLKGFASWMKGQAEEERLHAEKFFNYMIDRNLKVKLSQIAAPPVTWASPLAAIKAGLEAEQTNTGRLNDLMDLAIKERDHATQSLMQWFVDEQVEEEASFGELVDQLKLAEKAPGALFMLDRELSQRKPASSAGGAQ